jgi:hypothetical protein
LIALIKKEIENLDEIEEKKQREAKMKEEQR